MQKHSVKPSRFPDLHHEADLDDIVAIGGDFSVDLLVDAYSHGIFPWPMEDLEDLPWFSPLKRAVLVFRDLHVSRSLKKALKKAEFTFTIDKDFRAVIEACASTPRPGQNGTWITDAVLDGYTELHRAGWAHSVEVWKKGALVGGVYGVDGGGIFSAESMFFRESYASKAALLFLFQHLESKGLPWVDIQVMTPHMRTLGAKNISRPGFLKLFDVTKEKGLELFPRS